MIKTIRTLVAVLAMAAISFGAQAVTTIHVPDGYLNASASSLTALETNTLKCVLIDITSYNRATDLVLTDLTQISGTGYTAGGQAVTSVVTAADTTNHWTTVTITCAVWSGSTTLSATGAAVIDTTDGNLIVGVSDFGATVASTAGTYTVAPIIIKFATP